QQSITRAPVAGATPSAQPSLVTTAPARSTRLASSPRAAASSPGRGGGTAHSSVCTQCSQPASAASAAATISASGDCPGSPPPAPAHAPCGFSGWSSGCAPPRYARILAGPAANPAAADLGPITSVQPSPAAAGPVSHHSRHLLALLTAANRAASTNVSCASSR